jgi:hypothetical protein
MFSGFLVLGSLCGMISLAWLLVQLRTQTRQRLRLSSARTAPGGIDVLIQYRPARTRVGLSAKLTLLDNDKAQLIGGVREERLDRYGAYGAKIPLDTVAGRSIEVILRNLQPDPPGVFAGVFYVSGAEGAPINAARIRIEIWTEVGPTCLTTRDMTVRAINW